MTIAQIVYDNELSFGYTPDDIEHKVRRIWTTMDDCIRTGVSTSEAVLPGRLGLRRRAPMLYRRLMRGYVRALLDTDLSSAPASCCSMVGIVRSLISVMSVAATQVLPGHVRPGQRPRTDRSRRGHCHGRSSNRRTRRRHATPAVRPADGSAAQHSYARGQRRTCATRDRLVQPRSAAHATRAFASSISPPALLTRACIAPAQDLDPGCGLPQLLRDCRQVRHTISCAPPHRTANLCGDSRPTAR